MLFILEWFLLPLTNVKTVLNRGKVIHLQEIANNAWPAKNYLFLNGWILRFTDGATSRANSVLPLYYYGNNLKQDINFVEKAYRKYNLPVKFMLHDYYEPSKLYSRLVELDYQAEPIVDILGTKLQHFKKEVIINQYQYVCSSERTKAWSEALVKLATNRSKEDLIGILGIIDRITIPLKKLFAAVTEDQIIGIVLGILQSGYLGIMDLIVDPDYRRQGVATTLLYQSVEWATTLGGTHIYLQVVRENHEAIALYKKLHFKKWYSYFYMTKK